MEQSHKHSQLPKTQTDHRGKCGYAESGTSDSSSDSEIDNSSSDSHNEQEFAIRETNFAKGQLKLKIGTRKIMRKPPGKAKRGQGPRDVSKPTLKITILTKKQPHRPGLNKKQQSSSGDKKNEVGTRPLKVCFISHTLATTRCTMWLHGLLFWYHPIFFVAWCLFTLL